jgi:hypothetical protein
MNSRIKGAVAGAISSLLGVVRVAAQDTASAGNGGTADASADGGAVSAGNINSGGNAGNAIAIGDTGSLVCDKWGKCVASDGSVTVYGGDVSNSTSVSISANGGTAVADASGGDYNVAFVS